MLAMLLMNRMSMKRRLARRQQVIKTVRSEKKPLAECCRTCLCSEDLVTIFYNKETEQKRTEDLYLVTGLEIKMDDGLSQKICSRCVETINLALQFRRTSKKAEKTLINMLTGTGAKVKKKSPKLQKNIKSPKLAKPTKIEKEEREEFEEEYINYDVFDDDYQNADYEVKEEEERTTLKQKPSTAKKKRIAIPNQSSYKCATCNKEFRMKSSYKAHMRFHTNYCVCEACGKRCRNNNQLQEHKRARHGLGRIHKCAYCEYSSATKEALTIHERRHTGERSYTCDHCLHKTIHERRHTGERPYICDHCGATFHRRSNLVQHIAIHLPENNFQCDVCSKRLKSRKFLQIHKHNAHTGRRYGYLCLVCHHRFETLLLCLTGATGECDVCSKRLKSRKFLQIHKHNAHTGRRYGYLCPVCHHRFEKPNKVRAHTRRVHGLPDHEHPAIVRVQL